ncbi:MAG: cytochrome c4 [Gammaproteobacteria bacterium]|nr:cytochrome c4 [Gammaproteobacteria bacterium]
MLHYVKTGLSCVLGILLVSGMAQAAGDVSAGKTKTAACAGCHGPDGNSVMGMWPKLAGQHADYISKQLSDFKSGARKDPTMTAMSAGLKAQDIEDIAAYYSSQPISAGVADAGLVAAGEKLYRAGNKEKGVAACMACHGPAGTGNAAAKFPSVGGQQADYVAKALKDFRSGARTNDNAKMMQDVAVKLSDDDIKAVASYVSGLR